MTLEEYLKETRKTFYTLGVSIDKLDNKVRFYIYDQENYVISFEVIGNQVKFICKSRLKID